MSRLTVAIFLVEIVNAHVQNVEFMRRGQVYHERAAGRARSSRLPLERGGLAWIGFRFAAILRRNLRRGNPRGYSAVNGVAEAAVGEQPGAVRHCANYAYRKDPRVDQG